MKAVLVMDMPEKCWLCLICLEGEEGSPAFGVCWRSGELIWNPDYKPDWCPLRPLPERRRANEYSDDGRTITIDTLAKGWNACIDAITGGDDESDKDNHNL